MVFYWMEEFITTKKESLQKKFDYAMHNGLGKFRENNAELVADSENSKLVAQRMKTQIENVSRN
jgi:hypothetical protein